MIKNLIKGNRLFKKYEFPNFQKDMEESIKHGQKPEILFIGCSDSRVTPDLFLNTKPGDMFILRNVGNFVPKYKHDEDFHGSAAAIEYAVSILKIKDIIVCGHSHCGACESLYKELPNTEDLVHIKTWLKLGEKAKADTLKENKFTTKSEMYRETEKNSIKHQLENLLSYPGVLKAIQNNELTLHGWHYSIEDAGISYYNKEKDKFCPLEELQI
ncbi:MAG: carbonic anhydrase [Campylobacterales bacterium]|nr:carbonic anhydrase [Campylobacterales bacterium]NQY54062.1 carbonic anhydrase [Campylobacteraceae bacterium]